MFMTNGLMIPRLPSILCVAKDRPASGNCFIVFLAKARVYLLSGLSLKPMGQAYGIKFMQSRSLRPVLQNTSFFTYVKFL